MAGMTTRELLEKLYNQDYEKLKGKKLRMTRVRVPGKEVCLAHVINPSQSCIYQNLGLHIGVHEGEDHTGEAIGMIRFTPWEAVVVAADKCKCGDWFHGSLQRIIDPYGRSDGSSDCSGRSGEIF